MKLKIKNKNGVILKTKNTVVTEDIEVVPDESIINGSGSYEDGDELVYGGEKATQYGQVLVTDKKIDLMANEVLDMTGKTQGQTLDELTTTLEGVNNEIDTQGDLIAQLQAAVDSLPEAGSGSGEDVTAEVFEYTNKIASLESAVASLEAELANKASGGTGSGSLETCSLTLDFSARLNAAAVFYHTLEDGEVIGKIAFMNPDLPILTIEVLCNYYIVFDYNGYNLPGFTCENAGGGAVGIGAGAKHKYKITAPKGGNAKITVYNND